jgi:hypothetical protein
MTATFRASLLLIALAAVAAALNGCRDDDTPGVAAQPSATGGHAAAGSPIVPASPVQTAPMVTLSWSAPVLNTNGTTAANLAGYHIYYGSSPETLNQVVTVDRAESTSYTIQSLAAGNWFFAIAAYTTDNVESDLSPVVPVELGS